MEKKPKFRVSKKSVTTNAKGEKYGKKTVTRQKIHGGNVKKEIEYKGDEKTISKKKTSKKGKTKFVVTKKKQVASLKGGALTPHKVTSRTVTDGGRALQLTKAKRKPASKLTNKPVKAELAIAKKPVASKTKKKLPKLKVKSPRRRGKQQPRKGTPVQSPRRR